MESGDGSHCFHSRHYDREPSCKGCFVSGPGSSSADKPYLKNDNNKGEEKNEISDNIQNCPSLWGEAIINDIDGDVPMVEEGVCSQNHEVKAIK